MYWPSRVIKYIYLYKKNICDIYIYIYIYMFVCVCILSIRTKQHNRPKPSGTVNNISTAIEFKSFMQSIQLGNNRKPKLQQRNKQSFKSFCMGLFCMNWRHLIRNYDAKRHPPLYVSYSRRFHSLPPQLRHFGYWRRLERLNLFDLQTRRLRGQLIETFKILKGMTNIDFNNLFTLSTNQTRSNGYKLELQRYKTNLCGNFFAYKIANTWNKLPVELVNSNTVEEFKKKLDKIIKSL